MPLVKESGEEKNWQSNRTKQTTSGWGLRVQRASEQEVFSHRFNLHQKSIHGAHIAQVHGSEQSIAPPRVPWSAAAAAVVVQRSLRIVRRVHNGPIR